MNREAIADVARRADQWLEAHKEELIREIQAMVRIPSVSRPGEAKPGAPFGEACRRVLEHALERGRAYGFDSEDLDGYAGVISMGKRENAIGMISHLDVVPVGDGWIYPPFEGVYLAEHDAIIGRGADDNKGPAVMGLFVMRMLREWGVPLRHGLALYVGTSEENGMHDMNALRKMGHAFPKLSLVPDAGFPVNYGQKGSLNGFICTKAEGNLRAFEAGNAFNVIPDRAECVIAAKEEAVMTALEALPEELRNRLTVETTDGGVRIVASGQSGHAAHPDGSVNAIGVLSEALTRSKVLTGSAAQAVDGLHRLTQDSHGISEGVFFEDEISGSLTLVYSMTSFDGGVLRVGLDSRYPITCPGEELQASLTRAWDKLGYAPDGLNRTDPFYIDKESPYVTALQEVYHTLTGRDDPPYTMGGGTYSRAVPNAISFGPGVPGPSRIREFLPEGHGGAHGRDEVLLLEKVTRCARIYAAALMELDELVP